MESSETERNQPRRVAMRRKALRRDKHHSTGSEVVGVIGCRSGMLKLVSTKFLCFAFRQLEQTKT